MVPSIRMVVFNCNSNFRGSDTLYWFLWTLFSHKHRLIDKIKSKIIFKGKLFVLSIFPDHWESPYTVNLGFCFLCFATCIVSMSCVINLCTGSFICPKLRAGPRCMFLKSTQALISSRPLDLE